MPNTTPKLSAKRWAYIKSIAPAAPRYLHISCECGMRPANEHPAAPLIPWVSKGETYNVGRNKAKREKRAAMRAILRNVQARA